VQHHTDEDTYVPLQNQQTLLRPRVAVVTYLATPSTTAPWAAYADAAWPHTAAQSFWRHLFGRVYVTTSFIETSVCNNSGLYLKQT